MLRYRIRKLLTDMGENEISQPGKKTCIKKY